MRFIEFTVVLLCINLALALFAQVGISGEIIPKQNITGTESIQDGNILNTNKSMAAKINTWYDSRSYIQPGVLSTSQQYLQAGTDFIQAWKIFTDVFLGTFLLYPTLRAFGVPHEVCWFFVIPYLVLFVIAVVQFFSGREIEPR